MFKDKFGNILFKVMCFLLMVLNNIVYYVGFLVENVGIFFLLIFFVRNLFKSYLNKI